MDQISQLVGLKKFAELRAEKYDRKHIPWFQGRSGGSWRVGKLVKFENSYAVLNDQKGDFVVMSSDLCFAEETKG